MIDINNLPAKHLFIVGSDSEKNRQFLFDISEKLDKKYNYLFVDIHAYRNSEIRESIDNRYNATGYSFFYEQKFGEKPDAFWVFIEQPEYNKTPQEQLYLLSDLEKEFPLCRFICTTNSPIIIGGTNNTIIYNVDFERVFNNLYRLDYDSILNIAFGKRNYGKQVESEIELFENACKLFADNLEVENETIELIATLDENFKTMSSILNVEIYQIYKNARKSIEKTN